MWCLFHFCAYLLLCFAFHCMAGSFSEKTVLHSQLSQMNIIILVPVLCSRPHSNSSRSEAGAPAVNASMAAILWHTTAYCGCQTFFGQSSSCHSLAFPLGSCPGLRAPSGLSMHIWPNLTNSVVTACCLVVVQLFLVVFCFFGWMRHDCWSDFKLSQKPTSHWRAR